MRSAAVDMTRSFGVRLDSMLDGMAKSEAKLDFSDYHAWLKKTGQSRVSWVSWSPGKKAECHTLRKEDGPINSLDKLLEMDRDLGSSGFACFVCGRVGGCHLVPLWVEAPLGSGELRVCIAVSRCGDQRCEQAPRRYAGHVLSKSVCDSCGEHKATKTCGGCGWARYCNRSCQRAHRGGHKAVCVFSQ